MKFLSHIAKTPLLNQFAFYALLGSGAFVILLWSPNVLGKYLDHWETVITLILPWLMLWLAFSWQAILDKDRRLEIILIVSIIILGVLNTLLSDVPSRSTSPMRIFLASGIFALWTSMFIITGPRRRRLFDWVCCICLAVILPVEVIWWLVRDINYDSVFNIMTLHAIPLGTLIILLSPGPIHLLASQNFKIKTFGLLLFFSSLMLIFITHKRSTWLAVGAMLVVGVIGLSHRRKYLLAALLLVIALIFTIQGPRLYARLDPNVPRYASILQRVELYNFAFRIWQTHPFLGTGLRPLDHAKYLEDYHQVNQNLIDFPQSVTKLQTFDNMLLTGLVELGSLMTLAYLALVTLIMARYVQALRSSLESSARDWYRLLTMVGLAILSMSYDSLLFPPINWLFHVQLGIMAGYYAAPVALNPVGAGSGLPLVITHDQ